MKFFDSHCHLNIIDNLNIVNLINYLKKKKFKYLLCVSININNFIDIFNNYSNIDIIYFSCGIHPKYINLINYKEFLYIEKFINYKKVISIGETGLDYYNNFISVKLQKLYFEYHLYLSYKYNKVCIIHSRSSYNDTINIIKNFYNFNINYVIHCFSYNNIYQLKKFLDMNLYISFSWLVFKNYINFKKIINYVPLDRLIVETDSPYLSPYINKVNYPYNIFIIIKKISIIKNINFNLLSKILFKNFINLFKI